MACYHLELVVTAPWTTIRPAPSEIAAVASERSASCANSSDFFQTLHDENPPATVLAVAPTIQSSEPSFFGDSEGKCCWQRAFADFAVIWDDGPRRKSDRANREDLFRGLLTTSDVRGEERRLYGDSG